MPNRAVFTITPGQGGWEVVKDGQGALQNFGRKYQAVKWGREHARREPPSQLRVKGTNGRIQNEYTYGNDPRSSKG